MNQKVDYDKLNGLLLFWYYPAEWWNRRHWFTRLFWLLIVFATVSAISIAAYDTAGMREVVRLNEIQRQQIGELSKVIENVKVERETAQTKREDKVLNEIVDLQDQLWSLREQSAGLSNAEFNASVEEALAALEASGSATQF